MITSPTKPDIKLVVFDLGRVLIRICDSWMDACNRAGLTAPEGISIDTPELRALSVRLDTGDLSGAGFAELVSPQVRMTPEQVHVMTHAFVHGPYPGAEQLIDDIHARGFATACLSNTNESHWAIVGDPTHPTHFPLQRLTHRFASHLIRLRKPDPAIYAHLEQETGVPPASIVFFDDMEVNIEAARQRGWRGHHVDPKSPDPIAFIRECLRADGVLD